MKKIQLIIALTCVIVFSSCQEESQEVTPMNELQSGIETRDAVAKSPTSFSPLLTHRLQS